MTETLVRPETAAALPATSVVSRVRCNDVIEQTDALPFWRQDYTQLTPGSFQGRYYRDLFGELPSATLQRDVE